MKVPWLLIGFATSSEGFVKLGRGEGDRSRRWRVVPLPLSWVRLGIVEDCEDVDFAGFVLQRGELRGLDRGVVGFLQDSTGWKACDGDHGVLDFRRALSGRWTGRRRRPAWPVPR